MPGLRDWWARGSSVSPFKICGSISMARCIGESACMDAEGVWIRRLNLPCAFASRLGFDLAFLFAFPVKLAEMPELLL